MKAAREIGKTYQCWYNDKLCEATITGNKYRWAWVTARIAGTEEEVTIRGDRVRWDSNQTFAMQQIHKKQKQKEAHHEEKPDRKGIGRAVVCRSSPDSKKDQSVLRSLMRIKNNLCGVGMFSVKTRLTFLSKAGDAYASILRNAIEAETVNIHLMKNCFSVQTLSSYHFQRIRAIKALAQLCSENRILYGVYTKDPTMFCVRLSNGTVIGYPILEWGIKIKNLPSFDGEWDGKETWNLRRLEDEILQKYSHILW